MANTPVYRISEESNKKFEQIFANINNTFMAVVNDKACADTVKAFVAKTQPAYYLLRFSRHNIIKSLMQKYLSYKEFECSVYQFGRFENKILLEQYGGVNPKLFDDNCSNTLICECAFWKKNYQFRVNSSIGDFAKKFAILNELLTDTLPNSNWHPFGALKAVFSIANGMFADNFFIKWNSIVDCKSSNSLIETISPFLGSEKVGDNFIELGELTCLFLHNQWFKHNNFFLGYQEVQHAIETSIDAKSCDSFRARLLALDTITDKTILTVEDLDMMSGIEFERFVGNHFAGQGYLVTYTPQTGDQGLDIIAEKNGKRIGIQAKRYTGKINNSAIQEVVAGKIHHRCDTAMVITNSYFTKSAIDLATTNDVILWDRTLIKDKFDNYVDWKSYKTEIEIDQ